MNNKSDANKRWRLKNPELWKEINRKNQKQWQETKGMDKILEKHQADLANDPERLSLSFLKNLIINRGKVKEEEPQ